MSGRVLLPSSFGRRASRAIGPFIGAPLMVLVGLALDRSHPKWAFAAVFLVIGVAILVWAWLMRRRPALIFDEQGIWSWNQKLLLEWSDAALIWIGQASLPGRSVFSSVNLFVWTADSLAYARRTGFSPEPRLVVAAESTVPLRDIPALIHRFATCPVRTGSAPEFRCLIDDVKSEPGGE